jgi:hypothetical protein
MNEELISKLSEAYQTILKLPITAFQDPTLVRLLEILSLPQKANDLESAKKRLAEIMAVACPACGTPMGINPEDGKLGCPHVACCNIGGQNSVISKPV